ncbi:MAG: AAA family ATPase [Variovorax sp.]
MSSVDVVTVRVTGLRSQNPKGWGGAIFTGVPIDAQGSVIDACAYIVVKASRATLGDAIVERGQWWNVSGPVTEQRKVIDGFEVQEKQIDANAAHLTMPSGEHLVTFLSENKAFEGIGLVKARRLWEKFGENLYAMLDSGDAKAFVPALQSDMAERLVEAWSKHGESRALQWLQTAGFDLRLGRKVLKFFGEETQARIEEDPYRLLSFSGSWTAVDQLARSKFGVEVTDPRRLQGAVEEACHRLFANGHTAMLSSQLMDRLTPLLGSPPPGVRWIDLQAAALSRGLANGSFVQISYGLQPLGAHVMERQVAAAIAERLASTDQALLPLDQVDRLIAAGEQEDAIQLNQEQKDAIRLAAQHTFVCITGGAGVGKTTVLKSMYRLYDEAKTKIIQVALAGRAAKRMQEATGRAASTIASFLGAITETTFDGPTVLVVDEASMVDIISMSSICQVLAPHVRLVLVGDPHQLMPVGPGLVLHSLMRVPGVSSVELKTVKRYGGDIAALASAIRAGNWLGMTNDETANVAFLPCKKELICETIVDLFALDPRNTQILGPLRNAASGTKSLNEVCQARFTRGGPLVTRWNDEFEAAIGCGFHLDDMVLCKRNLWDKGLQNGSLGRIVDVAPVSTEPEEADTALAWIEWDDGVRRALTVGMLDDVELGYAITVHKAQGSQWRRILIPVVKSRMLDRTLLYTAVTRAQAQVILVGDIVAAEAAALAPPNSQLRNVALDLALNKRLSLGLPT